MTDDVALPQQGRCLCGAVRVRMRPRTDTLSLCHCDMCRRWTGIGLLSVEAWPEAVEVTGPVARFASSDWAERAWCATCGSALYYRVTLPGQDHFALAAGLFDDAGGLALAEEIYIDAKPRGYALAGTHDTRTRAEMDAIFASFGEEPEQ